MLARALVGVLLLCGLAAWALFSRPEAPGGAETAGAVLLVAVGLVAGALLGRLHPSIPGTAVAVGAGAAFVLTAPGSLSDSPLAPPLGYANANGALLLAAAAGAVTATSGRTPRLRLLGIGVAAASGVACLLIGAQAATVACVLLLGWALSRDRGGIVAWQATAGLLLLVPIAATFAYGAGSVAPPAALQRTLSEQRFALWRDAFDQVAAEPVRGVGAGRFAELSPTAGDPDLRWAHSAALQTAAELGVVGLAFLLAALVWGVVALGRDAVVLAALMLPASVDYVLQFGWVLVAYAVVLGGLVGRSRSSGPGKPWLTPPSP